MAGMGMMGGWGWGVVGGGGGYHQNQIGLIALFLHGSLQVRRQGHGDMMANGRGGYLL